MIEDILTVMRHVVEIFRDRQVFRGKRWWVDKPVNRIRRWLKPSSSPIHIDVISYTGETMLEPLSVVLWECKGSGDLENMRIVIRVLVRHPQQSFLIREGVPREIREAYDTDVGSRITSRRQAWLDLMQPPFENVSVELRMYRNEPVVKCLLVNQAKGFVGLYRIKNHTKTLPDGQTATAPDYVADSTDLIELFGSRRPFEQALRAWVVDWFDVIWTHPTTSPLSPREPSD